MKAAGRPDAREWTRAPPTPFHFTIAVPLTGFEPVRPPTCFGEPQRADGAVQHGPRHLLGVDEMDLVLSDVLGTELVGSAEVPGILGTARTYCLIEPGAKLRTRRSSIIL